MKIKFLGALGVVTGSCTWMHDEANNWNFLVDCGMQQGEWSADVWNKQRWPFDPAKIKFVVLTHAHIDHCGLLPRLYSDGFKGKVYCTQETRKLATILLHDAARHSDGLFQPEDVDQINWHEPGGIPLLGGTYHPVDQDLFLRFFRTGHILGAVAVAVYWGPKGPQQRSITFSGDIGPCAEDSEHLPFLRFRQHPVACDYAVVESTYGGRKRSAEETDPESRREQLSKLIDRTIDGKGTLILPSFALGRTQDVLFDLHWIVAQNPAKYGCVKYYLDAPTARRIHEVLLPALERTETNGRNGKVRPLWLGKQMFRVFGLEDANPDHVQRVLDIAATTLGISREGAKSRASIGNDIAQAWRPILTIVKDRDELLTEGLAQPCVLVTGSGSCDGGPAQKWLPELLGSPGTTVAMTGYCPPSSVSGQLYALRTTPLGERERHMGHISWASSSSYPIAEIRASIEKLNGYSAHADQEGLLDWLFWLFKERWNASGRTIFIQHGEDTQRTLLMDATKQRASDLGLETSVILPTPTPLWFDLDKGEYEVDRQAEKTALLEKIARLQNELCLLAD